MANPNWQADFEQALAEEDRSDPSANNIFQNRGLAKMCIAWGVIAGFVAVFALYASHSDVVKHDDQEWWGEFAMWCAYCACIQVILGSTALVLLRKRRAAPNEFQNRAQRTSGPPIGW